MRRVHRVNTTVPGSGSIGIGGTQAPPRRGHRRKRQRVDALTTLILADAVVERDAKTYGILRKTARQNIARGASGRRYNSHPTLYRRFRGDLFPIADHDAKPLRPWRHISDWLKAQIAALCIHQGRWRPFTIKLHDELLAELTAVGTELKAYLRDRLTRCLRKELGRVPWFMFIIENRTKSGLSNTRPHVHGLVQILPADLPRRRDGSFYMRDRIAIKIDGLSNARVREGEERTLAAMKAASGNTYGERAAVVAGRRQSRNVWFGRPLFALWNPEWVSYMFKNSYLGSSALGPDRLVMSQQLTSEAAKLWELVRTGESAIHAWD